MPKDYFIMTCQLCSKMGVCTLSAGKICTYLKSAATLFINQKSIGLYLRYSNEIICIHVAQGAAKLMEITVEGAKKKKNCLTTYVSR